MSKIENVLLSLAYCWFLDRNDLQRLHYPVESTNHVQDVLTALNSDDLIEEHRWSLVESVKEVATGKMVKRTKRQPSMWQLSEKGHRTIEHLPAYPRTLGRSRPKQLFEHDKRTNATIVRIIEIARGYGLSGINVQREVKLNPNPKVRRPVIDALVIFETGGTYSSEHADLLPWSSDPHLKTEATYRIAIEADNDTEPGQVIAGKASSYQKVLATPSWRTWWNERYGQSSPIVAWVVPSEVRAEAIVRHWEQAWPQGEWVVTSDQGLALNRWMYRFHGRTDRNVALAFPSKDSPPVSHIPPVSVMKPTITDEWKGVDSLSITLARSRGLSRAEYDRECEEQRVAQGLEHQRREELQRQREIERCLAEQRAAEEQRIVKEQAAQVAALVAAEAERQRCILVARRYKPWWWAYWGLLVLWQWGRWMCLGVWWCGMGGANILGYVLLWWWECMFEGEVRPEGQLVRGLVQVALAMGVVIMLWKYVFFLAAPSTAVLIASPIPTSTICGTLTTDVALPLRAEPRLAAPQILPARIPTGQVVTFLCETTQSYEQVLEQGQQVKVTMIWAKIEFDGVMGWSNKEYLSE